MTKPLLATLKTKKRYVVYEALSDKDIKHKHIFSSIQNSFKDCFGIFGLGKAGLMDTKLYNDNRGVLKINHKYVNHLRVSMMYIKEIQNTKVLVHVIGVSGILKKAKNKYMKNIAEKR